MSRTADAQDAALAALDTPPSANLFEAPLDYVVAENERQRALCWLIEQVAGQRKPDTNCFAGMRRFLREDFRRHLVDEEEDLFPLLRRRAEPDDRLGDILGELSLAHSRDRRDAAVIVGLLSESGAERAFTEDARTLLRRFAANERHRLVVENAIVLPLARARLTKHDLRTLVLRMAARRGLERRGGSDAV